MSLSILNVLPCHFQHVGGMHILQRQRQLVLCRGSFIMQGGWPEVSRNHYSFDIASGFFFHFMR